MALRFATILLICSVGCALAQYGDESGGGDGPIPPKKPLHIPSTRFKPHSARIATPTAQTVLLNQRFRRPIPINRPRPSSEPIPELPVFTSGIRGSRPSSAPLSSNLDQRDNDQSPLPIQAVQQPQRGQQQQQQPHHEVKPVNEDNEKDQNVVQVIANLGAVSGNLVTPTASPAPPSPTPSIFFTHQQDRQHQQQIQPIQYRPAPQISRSSSPESQAHQVIAPVQYKPQKPFRLQKQQQPQPQQHQSQHQLQAQQDQQNHRQQQQHQHQLQAQQEQQNYRQQQQSQHQLQAQQEQQNHRQQQQNQHQLQVHREQQNHDQQQQHHHQQQQQKQLHQQQIIDRNQFDINEPRSIAKQRTPVAPKKAKAQTSDYLEGRNKKPVAQVIRRYREETADGSIIWGFENDDGSFKEEIIGIDCITRGKYGYVDPDGQRRDYTYETGIKCDEETQQQQDQDILNTFVDYQENKLVLPSGKTIDLSSMGKKQARRPQQFYRN